LQEAVQCGLDVPDTLVTADVQELRRFIAQHGSVVTKAASDAPMLFLDKQTCTSYTSLMSLDVVDGETLWRGGFPSLFQERLCKEYEVRSFYLTGTFYSMAIFSQQHLDTEVDFRKYVYTDPSRCVPYKLPPEIEESLTKLMERLGLQTGSIDLVRTKDGRLVFLEVNPVGQFGMTSYPCNYFLEKKVAAVLAGMCDVCGS
jgi:hypothetical protein